MADKNVIASLQAQIDSITSAASHGNRNKAKASSRSRTELHEGLDVGEIEEFQSMGVRPLAPVAEANAPQSEDDLRHSDPEAALKKIIALVNVSDRSEHSIRERLAKEGFTESAIDESVERAKAYSFINDERFAEVLVRSRIAQGKGSAGIVRELAGHGIDAESVPGWPYEFPLDYEEELDRALDLLERKPPRSKNLREGAYRRLVQKGYPSSIASSAARLWSERPRTSGRA